MTRYLDEQFIFSFTGLTIPVTTVYQYTLTQTLNGVSKVVFTGLVFVESGTTNVTVNLTDVIRNYTKKSTLIKFSNENTALFSDTSDVSNSQTELCKYICQFYLSTSSSVYSNEGEILVAGIYRNPKIDLGIHIYDYYDMETDELCFLIQGGGNCDMNHNYYNTKFPPHIPFQRTNKYIFPFVIERSSSYSTYVYNLHLENTSGYNIQLTTPITERYYGLNKLYSMVANNITITKPTNLMIENLKVAVVDDCPSRYYLLWQDRGGGYQSQRFNDKYTYSEAIERNSSVNYKGETCLKNVQVLPKWKIYSEWITEEAYPIYESIFTSPFLLLYDSVEKKSHFVNVKGDYTEKRFVNQKALLNISLELEENKKQDIIY